MLHLQMLHLVLHIPNVYLFFLSFFKQETSLIKNYMHFLSWAFFFFFGLESFCFRGNLSLNVSLKFFSGFM